MNGNTPVVYIYAGHLAKSGKTMIEFAGHKMNHIDKAADKCSLLVHNETKVIVRAYPKHTERSKVLDDLAQNIEKLNHFIENPDEYETYIRPKAQAKKDNDSDVVYDTHKEPSYSREGNYAHLNKDYVEPREVPKKIKSYDLTIGSEEW